MGVDEERFAEACRRVMAQPRGRGGIGTLGEKTLHAALKHYYEPDEARHEVAIAGYVADILRPEGIVEIQTGGFDRLRAKLTAILPSWPVRVVYPVACVKYLRWVDPATDEVSDARRSPRKGSVLDAVGELYKIKNLLPDKNLTVCVALLELEEHKLLNGRGTSRKLRAHRAERVPLALQEEVYLGGEHGFDVLLPPGLPPEFTTADYRSLAKCPVGVAGTALHLLYHVGALQRVGKRGNAYVYVRA